MYVRLIMFTITLACFVVLATAFAQVITNAELERREPGTGHSR